MKINKYDKKNNKYDKKYIDSQKNTCYKINITTTRGVTKMAQYKFIYKKGGYKAGEEIRLHKVTTAERISGAMLKILLIAGIIVNLIIIHG